MNVDLTFLNQFTTGDKVKMAKYISIFLKSAPGILANIVAKHDEKDWEGLRIAAHTLKPQISYMGIKQMETLIRTIENNAGERKDIDQLAAMISELNTELQAAFKVLQAELDKLQQAM